MSQIKPLLTQNHLQTFEAHLLEEVPCGICGSTERAKVFSKAPFYFWDCSNCNVRYVSPRLSPKPLNDLYDSSQYFKSDNSLISGYIDYQSDQANIEHTTMRRMKWIMSHAREISFNSTMSFLDIGCAMGFTLNVAKQYNWNIRGIEISQHAASIAKETHGKNVFNGDLLSAYNSGWIKDNSFELITFWDVVEHLPEPKQYIEIISKILKPGGYISMITPDRGSKVATLFGKHWMEYAKPTEHIFFFNHSNINKLFSSYDMNPVAITTAGKYVDINFLAERLLALIKLPMPRLRSMGRLYIDVGDKLHVLARKSLQIDS